MTVTLDGDCSFSDVGLSYSFVQDWRRHATPQSTDLRAVA